MNKRNCEMLTGIIGIVLTLGYATLLLTVMAMYIKDSPNIPAMEEAVKQTIQNII